MFSFLHCPIWNSPVEESKNATPITFFLKNIDPIYLLDLSVKVLSAVSVPGVTTSTTSRLTIPFEVLGSSIC